MKIGNILHINWADIREYKKNFKELGNSVKALNAMEGSLNKETTNLIKSFKNGEVSLKGFLGSTVGLTVGITALVLGIRALHKAFPTISEATENLKQDIEEFNSVKGDVDSLTTELETCYKRLKELQDLGGLRTIVEDEELEKLKDTTVEYERQLAIKKEELRLSAKETLDSANDSYNGRFRSQYNSEGYDIAGNDPEITDGASNPAEELHNAILNYEKNKKEYDRLKADMDMWSLTKDNNPMVKEWYDEALKESEKYKKAMDAARERASEMYETTSSISSAYENLELAGEDLSKTQHEQYLVTKNADNEYNEFCQSLDETATKYEKLSNIEQRNTFQRKLMQSGKNSDEAKEIVDSISDDKIQYASEIVIDKDSTISSVNASIEEVIRKGQQTADENPIKVSVSRSAMIDKIAGLSDGFNVLDEIYADNKDGDVFDFSKLNTKKFEETFKSLGVEYDDFIEKIASSPNDLSKTQEAYDSITTALIKQSGILNDVNEENKNVTKSYLDLYGVTNAQELVNYQLAKADAEVLLQEKFLIDSHGDLIETKVQVADETGNLINETDYEIEKFIEEANASGIMSDALAMTLMEKILFSNTSLNTSADIENLLTLAEAAGYTSDVIIKLNKLREDYNNETDAKTKQWIGKTINEYTKQLQGEIANWTPTAHYSGADKSNKSSSSSSEKDKWLDEYKKKLSILQDELDKELIDEREFYDKSESLMNQYLKDTPEHIKKYEEEISNAEKTLHSDWINAFESQKKKLDDLYNNSGMSTSQYYNKLSKLAQEYYGTEIQNMQEVIDKMMEMQKLGNVDLFNRPLVDANTMRNAGYEVEEDETATVYSLMDFIQNSKGEYVAIHYTPILPDGTVLDEQTLEDYLYDVIQGSENMIASDNLGIILNVEDINIPQEDIKNFLENGTSTPLIDEFLEKSDNWDVALHELQASYYGLGESVDKYGKYTKEASEAQKELNEIQKTVLNNAIEGATYLIDRQIDKYEKLKDAAEKSYNAQTKAIDSQIKAIENEIDNYDHLIDEKQRVIDKMKEENDEHDRQIALQKAKSDLDKALNNNTVQKFVAGQWVLGENDSDIANARESVRDAEYDIEEAKIQKEIDLLEESKSALEEQKELLEKQKEAIEEMIDKSNEYFDKMIESLNETKTKWEELGEIQSQAKIMEDMKDVLNEFGLSAQDVLNMSDETFATFKDKYMDYMMTVTDKSESVKDALSTMADVGEMEWLDEYLQKSALGVAEIAGVDLTGAVDSINGVSDSLNSVMESAKDASIAIGAVDSSDNKKSENKKDEKETSLTTAIAETYETASATLPEVSGMFDGITGSVQASTNAVNELKSAIESLNSVASANISIGNIPGHAKGVKEVKKKENAWTQEEGRELIVSPTRNAMYTPLEPGDSVLTKAMTSNIFEWGKINPNIAMSHMFQGNTVSPATTNINNNTSSVVIENVNLNLPNVTNNSGAEYIQKELEKLSNNLRVGKYQYFSKI